MDKTQYDTIIKRMKNVVRDWSAISNDVMMDLILTKEAKKLDASLSDFVKRLNSYKHIAAIK